MTNENVELIRSAYEAYARGDRATMLDAIAPELEWTYLDPGFEDPEPQVCRGRHEFEVALARQAKRGLRSELEEVAGHGDRVLVVTRTPGIEAHRKYHADERNYDVFTVSGGRVVALRACRSRSEAAALAGVE